MKPLGIFGIILIIIGILTFIYPSLSFIHKEQVAKIGPVEVNANKKETIPISPIVGLVCVGGGIFLVLRSASHKSW